MYNSKISNTGDIEYESFNDNMEELSAQLPSDNSPSHLGWERKNLSSNELRNNDKLLSERGTDTVIGGIEGAVVYGNKKSSNKSSNKKSSKNSKNFKQQVIFNVPNGAIEFTGKDGKRYWMRQNHATGEYLLTFRDKPISYSKVVVPEGFKIPGTDIVISKKIDIGKIALKL